MRAATTVIEVRAVVTAAGRAWLLTYELARRLGFSDEAAQRQAFAAADGVRAQEADGAQVA